MSQTTRTLRKASRRQAISTSSDQPGAFSGPFYQCQFCQILLEAASLYKHERRCGAAFFKSEQNAEGKETSLADIPPKELQKRFADFLAAEKVQLHDQNSSSSSSEEADDYVSVKEARKVAPAQTKPADGVHKYISKKLSEVRLDEEEQLCAKRMWEVVIFEKHEAAKGTIADLIQKGCSQKTLSSAETMEFIESMIKFSKTCPTEMVSSILEKVNKCRSCSNADCVLMKANCGHYFICTGCIGKAEAPLICLEEECPQPDSSFQIVFVRTDLCHNEQKLSLLPRVLQRDDDAEYTKTCKCIVS
ncbi:uncharacterized protein LOC132204380 [Neocloeon triangulifer]|uniref:uncharacterized protein LOC132204380 n=1 Tax=Neocloeon triangulifer TaxID=2078957 RepID=UPI00286F633E|nr:uncharacterized protein LOC132204380 [Neocloeon triangulifer]